MLEALDPPQLEGTNRRQLICVANTHIHANPELNDVKLWQVSQAECITCCSLPHIGLLHSLAGYYVRQVVVAHLYRQLLLPYLE